MSKLKNLKLSVHQSLNELSKANIKLTYKFINDLAEKEREEATKELLEIPNLLEDIELAKQDISEGELCPYNFNIICSVGVEQCSTQPHQ